MQWSKSSKDIFSQSENPISRYKATLEITNKKHLLVEGITDKILFNILLKEIFDKTEQKLSKDCISVDNAEILTGFTEYHGRLGNREKVELVCEKLEGEFCTSKLVGFVDREFRDFHISDLIQDTLCEHKFQGRIVWTRGHSIENYFFDFSILSHVLTIFSPTQWLHDALNKFEVLLSSVMRLACAISLAANDSRYIKPIHKSINWQILQISGLEIIMQIDSWKSSLIKSQKLNSESVDKIVERYMYWYSRIETADLNVLRWICHGHIGISTIWAAYIRCVYEVCRVKVQVDSAPASNTEEIQNKAAFQEADKLYKNAKEEYITYNCGCYWASKVIGNEISDSYPLQVLRLLGIQI